MIYAMRAGPFLKIGFTAGDSAEQRLKSVATGCPFPMRVVGQRPGSSQLEKYFHQLLRGHSARGEWFYDGWGVHAICAANGLEMEPPTTPLFPWRFGVAEVDLRGWLPPSKAATPSELEQAREQGYLEGRASPEMLCPTPKTASYLINSEGMRGSTVKDARRTKCIDENGVTPYGEAVAAIAAWAAETVYYAMLGNPWYVTDANRLLSRVRGASISTHTESEATAV